MELHDRYWASRSVCVVRPGALTPPPRRAELFLLADVRTLARFSLREVLQRLLWAGSELIFVRLRARQTEQYRETVRTDAAGRFRGFTRHYDGTSRQVARLALTRDRRVAELWRSIDSAPSTWRSFRKQTRRWRRQALAVEGELYDRFCHEDLDRLVSDLIQTWPRPSASIEGLHEIRPGVWASDGHDVSTDTVFLGPAWIGAGRRVGSGESVLGPAALWDVASRRPDPGAMCWERLDPSAAPPLQVRPRQIEPWRRRTKRLFDIAFSVGALLGTLPLYPLIMLAIWLEDGGPFIFAHKRETLGGREFPCLKFRSMRKDADRMKAELAMRNESDGPQFFMKNDPRITRVGQFLRRSNLDELPQFINVLLGHMSVV